MTHYLIRRGSIYYFNRRLHGNLIRLSLKLTDRKQAQEHALLIYIHLNRCVRQKMKPKQIEKEAQKLAKELYEDWLLKFEALDIPERERLSYLDSMLQSDDGGYSDLCDLVYDGKLDNEALRDAKADLLYVDMKRAYVRKYRNPRLQLESDTASVSAPATSTKVILIGDALEEFLQEKQAKDPNVKAATLDEYRAAVRDFCEITEIQTVSEVTHDSAKHFRNTLKELPKQHRAKSQYKSMSIADLQSLNLPDSQKPSPKTINGKLANLSSLFDYLIQTDAASKNPFTGLQLRAETNSYEAFTSADLKTIFSSAIYSDPKYRRSTRTGTQSHWWLMVLAAFTGARIGELVQLRTQDINETADIPTLTITDDGEDMSVKTNAGIRTLPIHAALVELGFLDYVERLKKAGINRILPQIKMGTKKPGEVASKWFNERYRERCFPQFKEDKKVFHSFRHAFISQSLRCDMDIHKLQQMVGHEPKYLNETATYSDGFSIQQLKTEMDKFRYDDFSITDIKESWRELHAPVTSSNT
ncbi:MAG: site-specific integrase [Saccharospirillaceae bacterium]|nr:site-specific integrase [Saccharospirillaceae bacterium]MCD8532955.1 site-specific integrase [Saccharospirillaceae bacterium]